MFNAHSFGMYVNGGGFEAKLDQLPEVNEHTAYALIRDPLPPKYQAMMDQMKPQLLEMIKQRLIVILREKVQRAVASM